MNYIRHLTSFYDRIQEDNRLNPTHISLYLALFQFWNLNHFQNPISISRNEMMRLSKISAFGTYHKCIKDLQEFGYIEYLPSFNPYKGSLVNLYNFENSEVQNLNRNNIKKQTTSEQALNQHHIKNETGIRQALIPSINNTNILNNKHRESKKNISEKIDEIDFEVSEKEKLCQKKSTESKQVITPYPLERAGVRIPPEFYEVQLYFEEKDSTKLEAEKFYNHYESNGWLVGGKSKMKNWQAGARNWLLNSKKFNSVIARSEERTTKQSQSSKPNHLNATTNKSYQEKL